MYIFFMGREIGMQNLSKPLGYHSDVHGWRWDESLLAVFSFQRDTEPLPKECLNTSSDTSKKNINIKTHPATKQEWRGEENV